MEAIVKIKRPFPKQQEILADKTRFLVLSIGRQWGKSELALIDCVDRLLKGQFIWYCSPTHKNTKRMWPKFKAALSKIPQTYINNTDYIIRLPNGAFIQFISLHEPDNLRGEGLHHIVVDEAAFVPDGVYERVLRPMLAARRGSAWFISSPNGKNWFYHYYQRGLDPLETEYSSYTAPSVDSPVMSADEIESIRRDTTQRVFQQEYMAEFLDDGGAVFRNLKACIIQAFKLTSRENIIFGVDLARSNDYTVITVMDADSLEVIEIDRFSEIGWEIQRGRLLAKYQQWKPYCVVIEENFNDSFAERLKADGLPIVQFRTTSPSKQQIINSLALAFEQAAIGIPDNPTLLAELQAYTMEKLPSGTFRYSAPSGLHDDMVMSLAFALYGVTHNPTLREIAYPNFYDWNS